MNIAYIRPYTGELEIFTETENEHKFYSAENVADLDESVRSEIEVLSVFVDYQVTAEALDLLPNLKLIATRSAGYDHIDIEAAAKKGLVVSRVPHYGTRTVAEYAIALMFALSRKVGLAYRDMQDGSGVIEQEKYEGFDLCGKTLGVVGTGAIGRNVCQIAQGIGMKVLAFDVSPDEEFAQSCGVTYTSLDSLLSDSDIVTLHVPAMPSTHHLLDEEKISLMKSGSYIINTARGEIIDTEALVAALSEGRIAGAGLDVLEGEHELREEVQLLSGESRDTNLWKTLVADHALIDMPNVIVTPHIAFNTVEAKREITDITMQNIKAFAAGTPQNIVSVE